MKLFLLILFSFSAHLLLAQNISLSWKYTTHDIINAEWKSFICNNKFYVVSWKSNMKNPIGRDMQLDAFDSNGEFISSSGIIDAGMNSREPNLVKGIFPVKDRVVMFKAGFKKEGDKKNLDLYCYSFSDAAQHDAGKFLMSINSESMTNSGNYFIAVSPDGSRVAIVAQQPSRKNEHERISVKVYDDLFKEVWSRDYEFPFDNSKYPSNDVWINNNGTVFILKNTDDKIESPYQSMFVFKQDTVRQNKIDIGENNKIAFYRPVFNAQGDMILSGYYCYDKKFGFNLDYPKGTFYLKTGNDGSAVATNFQEGNVEAGMKLYDVLKTENDEVILVGSVMNLHSNPVEGKPFEYDYEFVSGHIHLYKLSSTGKAEWEYQTRRDFRRLNDGGRAGSVFACFHDGNIILIFTEHYYKYDGGGQKVIGPGRANKFINAIQTIDKNGKLISDGYIKGLGNDKSEEAVNIYLISSTGIPTDDRNVLFMGYSDKILYGIKLTF